MKQNVPFLPRLKMTRHLSTIVEGREENEDVSDASGLLGRPGENRHKRFNRRVHSCSDIPVARDRNKEHDALILPPLTNPEKTQRQTTYGSVIGPRGNQKMVGSTDNIFPDFRPPDRTRSIMDIKVSKYSSRSKSNAEDSFTQNKENIVASWLQFFG